MPCPEPALAHLLDAQHPTVASLLDRLRARASFAGLSDARLVELLSLCAVVTLEQDEVLVREGAPAEALYLLVGGELEVRKDHADSEAPVSLGVRGAGSVVGEVSFIGGTPRSATLVACGPCRLLRLDFSVLRASRPARTSLYDDLHVSISQEMARSYREATQRSAGAHHGRELEARKRAHMGDFVVKLLLATCTYMFAMGTMSAMLENAVSATVVGLPPLALFAGTVWWIIRDGGLPLAEHGLTLERAGGHAVRALLWTLPLLGLVVGVKAALLVLLPSASDEVLFDLGRHHDMSLGMFAAMAGVYLCLVPVQEMIARAGIQAPLTAYLTGRHRRTVAVLLAGLLFSATHLHLSARLALCVLPLGLFWGWLFDRQRSLVGVSLSHAVVGLFAFLVVGFDGILR